MTASSWLARPRLLAGVSLAFALVPVWLAWVTWRDARNKDERLFEASAQLLAEQLKHGLERNDYFLGALRERAQNLDDTALVAGRLAPPGFDLPRRLPHLLSFGFAAPENGQLKLRWRSAARAPIPAPDEILPAGETYMANGRRLFVLVPAKGGSPMYSARGSIVGWVDLDSLCRDDSIPMIRDHVLTVVPLGESEALPANARRATLREPAPPWGIAIARGERFSEFYGPPAPWLAFVAVGLSTVPLLVLASLASRAARLRTELAAEQEVASQQRFFTQSVSHEFRTPLGVILSGTDLLDRYAEHLTPERRREVLAEIRTSTRLMTGMVEGVLFLGRVESGKLACHPLPVHLAELCRDIERKVAATSGADAAISVAAPDREANLDAALVGSILENLVSNAVKYSPPSKPVSLSATVENGRVIFIVRDEGMGIPADELPRVGDPFHRCQNAGGVPGTGLGLTIARRCAELHGGTLALESTVGLGTTVTVNLPAA
ncbi:MAG TPA: HAMP domain-containing sensor histidine kinase [Chthoniobacteraceae bacterium]|jgi:signal transduction histidine kinase|nr:HAMP domain-containing sensor histidine kinase [Chthoniobacteraceae bacterium]